jgi:hypothetical protein
VRSFQVLNGELSRSFSFLATFTSSGQNLAVYSTTGEFSVEKTANISVDLWFKENVDATADLIKKLTTISVGAK